jgi:hypothetical protein
MYPKFLRYFLGVSIYLYHFLNVFEKQCVVNGLLKKYYFLYTIAGLIPKKPRLAAGYSCPRGRD